MRKTFDAELQELNYEMIDMAAAAEDAIDVAVSYTHLTLPTILRV